MSFNEQNWILPQFLLCCFIVGGREQCSWEGGAKKSNVYVSSQITQGMEVKPAAQLKQASKHLHGAAEIENTYLRRNSFLTKTSSTKR